MYGRSRPEPFETRVERMSITSNMLRTTNTSSETLCGRRQSQPGFECAICWSISKLTWGRRNVRGRLRLCPVISLLRRATLLSNRLLLRSESGNSTSRSPFRTLWIVPPTACRIRQPNTHDKTKWEGAGVLGDRVNHFLCCSRIDHTQTNRFKLTILACPEDSVGWYIILVWSATA